MSKKIILNALFLCVFLLFSGPVMAQDDSSAFRSTNYPLPRFVSLGSDKVYVRTGPGQKYPIKFFYKKSELPVEVILEYEAWRKIRDNDGDEGWVHKSLLSGRRTALVLGEGPVALYRKPAADSRIVAYAEPKVIGHLEQCENGWCRFEASGYKGWIEGKSIWGVYENEIFD